MAILKPELFSILNDEKVEKKLMEMYRATLKQSWSMILHFLPKLPGLLGKGIDWKTENESFYDDKYIPIDPRQGTFMYMQARALNAKNIFEFGTSYGISTIYLGKAARDNCGKVISTEYLSHKVKAARKHIEDAGLSDYVEILEGDARETLKNVDVTFDLVLLDGFPDMVYTIFKLIEPQLKVGAVILVDDVEGFGISMQDYLNEVRNPDNGYISTTFKPGKALEYTVKVK